LSLIADSLKKAIKEKTFNVAPGINLLKHLGAKPKSSSKLDPKEIKRFIILIVVPATILGYLLLAKPFTPNKQSAHVSAPVVAKAPPADPVPPSTPKPPASTILPIKEQKNIMVIEPGMEEVSLLEKADETVKPKLVAGPKIKSSPDNNGGQELAHTLSAMDQPLDQKKPSAIINRPETEKPSAKIPVKSRTSETQPPKIIKPMKLKKVPENFLRAPVPETDELSFTPTAEPDIFKNSDYYFNRAIFYQQSRNWEKALTNYSKAAELDANNPDIYNNIGVIYKELRQYDRAIEEFLRAIYLSPDYAKPYNNIGVVYYSKKDFLGAIRNYQKAVSIDPKNLEALNNLAVAYKRIDQLEKSKAVLNQALKINMAHAGTHYNLAVLYEEEGNLKSAIHFYQSFIDLGSTTHPTLSAQVRKHIKALK
jgi:Flp pilus assembly protein TadD